MADSDQRPSVDAGLKTKTGHGLDEWVALARATGIGKHKALVSHRVRLHDPGEVDAEVESWLGDAYGRA